MRQVADHLKLQALSADTAELADRFGRSAFNRLYYSSYWSVREHLHKYSQNWERLGHSAIPDKLRKEILKAFNGWVNDLKKTKVYSESEIQKYNYEIRTLLRQIAQELVTMRTYREIADYEPEKEAKIIENVLYLAGTKVSSAESIELSIKQKSKRLENISNDLGFI